MKITRHLTLAAIAAVLLFQASVTMAAAEPPLRITFSKCFVPDDDNDYGGHYQGEVDGDLGQGTVSFYFDSLVEKPFGYRFSGKYTIKTVDHTGVAHTVTAFAAGIDNLQVRSGHDVLNGVVTNGDYVGAQVKVRAEDYDNGNCSQGTITITPSR